MISLLFLVQTKDYMDFPSCRVRAVNLLPHLLENGIKADITPFPRSIKEKIAVFQKIKNYDVVCLQKKLITSLDLFWLRMRSKCLLFDLDDAIYQTRIDEKKEFSRTRYNRFNRIVKQVDHVLAGNTFLLKNVEKHKGKGSIIPSAVPVTGIPVRTSGINKTPVRIGWIGTSCNLPYLNLLMPVLQKLALDYQFELNIVCDKKIDYPGVNIVYTPWKLETQQQSLASMDIGVMPLPNNSWTIGKCGYKSLQYMSAGVVPVCSNVGDNAIAIENGVSGFAEKNIPEFYSSLKTLLENPLLRDSMGIAAREQVKENFSLEAVGKKTAHTIKSVLAKSC